MTETLWQGFRYGWRRLAQQPAPALVAAGIALGLLGAFARTRLMAGLLCGVSEMGRWTFAALAMLLCAIALLASWLTARRALIRNWRCGKARGGMSKAL